MDRIRTTVRIAGKEYTMVGNEPEEYIHRVAIYVDRKMQEIGYATKLSTNMLAVLTALNIADDMMKTQDENNRLRKELSNLRQELLRLQRDNALLMAQKPGGI